VKVSPLAGTLAPPSMLVNVPRLVTAYYADHPDASVATERVAFGTSGHRGSALQRTFNEAHILAITQAICTYRHAHGIGWIEKTANALLADRRSSRCSSRKRCRGPTHVSARGGHVGPPLRPRVKPLLATRVVHDASRGNAIVQPEVGHIRHILVDRRAVA
jgi:phosphoglucomutase/phosphomannomutase-like protein